MNFLTKEQILGADDRRYEDVPVPEWTPKDSEEPAQVRVLGLSGRVASEFSKKLVSVDGKGNVKELRMDNFMAELLSLTIVDHEFKPIFSTSDVAALGDKSAAVLKRLSDIATRLSGLNDTAIADAAKN